jgi:multiple sugar transport system substrate-binding protein
MKKRFLSIFLATTVVTTSLLTGCSSGSGKEDASGKTKVNVWAMGDEGKRLPEMVASFEKEHKNIDIEVQSIPWDQAHDKLLTAVASGKGPDIVQMGTSWMPEFADAGVLSDLSKYVEKYPNLNPDNFYEGALQSTKYKDKMVGIPWYIESRVLYYRKDLAKQVGYDKPPKNWDEFLDISKKLSARGDNLYGIDMNLKDQFFATTYAWQNGWKFDNANPKFNTKEFKETIKYLKQFYDGGLTPKKSDMDIVQAFKEGILPMFISGPWITKPLKEANIEGEWGVATLPGNKTNTSFMGGSNLVLFENSKNKDKAVEFISYMADEKNQMKWLEISDCLPSTKAAWENDALSKDEILSVYKEQINNTNASPMLKEWESIAQELNATLEKIFVGGEDANKALGELDKKVESMMK